MSEKRRGLGRGLGALIPTTSDAERPVDVFFAGGAGTGVASDVLSPRSAVDASDEDPGSRAAASEALGEALDAADDPQGSRGGEGQLAPGARPFEPAVDHGAGDVVPDRLG